MLAGASKHFTLLLMSILAPLYVFLFLAITFAPHFWMFMVFGVFAMLLGIMGIMTYKNNLFQGMRALGLTSQKDGGKDTFDMYSFRGYVDMGKGGTFRRYPDPHIQHQPDGCGSDSLCCWNPHRQDCGHERLRILPHIHSNSHMPDLVHAHKVAPKGSLIKHPSIIFYRD